MKKSRGVVLSLMCLFLLVMVFTVVSGNEINLQGSLDSVGSLLKTDEDEVDEEIIDISKAAYGITDVIDRSAISQIATEVERIEVYDGMTMDELATKLNKSLKGVLANQGSLIAERCIELGLDPYLAVAIMLHETGCSWSCSTLSTNYYNVGGMKATSNTYQKFSSIEAGINAFIDNLYYNYYSKGLTTPELINTKYASSTTWSTKIRSYMAQIKAA